MLWLNTGSKIITEYLVPDDCAGKSPEIFVCQLQPNPAFQKKITLEFTNEGTSLTFKYYYTSDIFLKKCIY